MIRLHLKDGKVIESESKDARMIKCTCNNVACNHCPFGTQCGTEFAKMSFGEAMKIREKEINNMVELVEETDDEVEQEQLKEPKKKYTFEFTDEQAKYLHAFMNIWEHAEIEDTLDVIDFMSADNPPFTRSDMNNIPKEWHVDDNNHIVNILHEVSVEIYDKLLEQREFDE